MDIHFQYRTLHLLSTDADIPGGNILPMDENDWPLCFKQLTEGNRDIAVRCSSLRSLLHYLHDNYIFVKAAGGIVVNSDGRRLLMVRNDRYDLPKGKVEAGETLAQAAIRETEEETGLSGLTLGPLLLKTYHIYNLYGGWHFKQTSWYAMHLTHNHSLVPQTEEGITDLQWLDADEWSQRLMTSYATMRNIVSQIADQLPFIKIVDK
jgi:NADH pyrophosphatase NudC (nudix superfamily)